MTNIQTTTIRVPKEVAESIKIYCKKHGRTIGDFVESAWNFIEKNDFDIYDEDITPFLPVKEEQKGKEVEALCKLMAEFINTTTQQKQLSLPTTEQITKATEERVKAEMKLEYLQKELEDIRKVLVEKEDELIDTADTLGKRTKLLMKAKDELKRLKKGFFNRPDEDVLKELGI